MGLAVRVLWQVRTYAVCVEFALLIKLEDIIRMGGCV